MKNKVYFTIGHLAKKVKVSVRTIQYYDNIGLLKPSKITESGRRLYDENDIALLHQILTLKSVGLSLSEIRNVIIPIENTEDVLLVLNQQADLINEKISRSMKILDSIKMIQMEVESSNEIDWEKYSNMMQLINDNNEYYWIINYIDKNLLNRISSIREEDPKSNPENDWLKSFLLKSVELKKKGCSPDSNEAQMLAESWWTFTKKYTNGNIQLINELYNFYDSGEKWPSEYSDLQKTSRTFLEETIKYYLTKNNLIKELYK